jgi:DNA polymerase III subunit beta
MLDPKSLVVFEPKKETVRATGTIADCPASTDFERWMDADTYPPLPSELQFAGHDVILDVELADIRDAWPFASRDDSRFMLNSIAIAMEDRAAKSWRILATDGRRLYCSREHVLPWMPMSKLPDGETTVSQRNEAIMLPLHEFLLLHTASGPWRLRINGSGTTARIKVAEWTIWAALIEGNYPNWKQVIPKSDYATNWQFSVKEGAQISKVLAGIPTGEKSCSIKLSYAKGKASVAYANPDGVKGKIQLPGVTSGDNEIAVNRDFLVDALNGSGCRVEVNKDVEPLIVRSDRDARMIVMPVRL